MADRFAGQIWIGGEVSREILPGLISALHDDGGSPEFGDAVIADDCTHPDSLADHVANYLDDESLLHLKNDQARNGEFESTEAFCIEHGIAFDRSSDHYCEYDAENVYFRPGMKEPLVVYADANGLEIVRGDKVRCALSKLLSFQALRQVDLVWQADRQSDFLDETLALLQEACPDLPDVLKSFQIVD